MGGREVLDVGDFVLIAKKQTVKAYLVLCTDVAFVAQMVDDDCYEMMFMPVPRTKVTAKLAKIKKRRRVRHEGQGWQERGPAGGQRSRAVPVDWQAQRSLWFHPDKAARGQMRP